MKKITKLYSENSNKVNAILFNGDIKDGGTRRNFKTSLFFNNEKSSEIKSFAKLDVDQFRTNEISIAFWILPKNKSKKDSPIFLNESDGRQTGIFYNCEDSDILGYKWNADSDSEPNGVGLKVNNTGWMHFVFIFTKDGNLKIFGNGKFIKYIDSGFDNEKVNFENMTLGGFNGYLDDFKIYNYPLNYGSVNIGETASQNVSYLFNLDRITNELSIPVNIDLEENNQPYYYIQNQKYLEVHNNYNLHKQNNHKFYSENSYYAIDGGLNSGKKRLADGSFRTVPGKIRDSKLEIK